MDAETWTESRPGFLEIWGVASVTASIAVPAALYGWNVWTLSFGAVISVSAFLWSLFRAPKTPVTGPKPKPIIYAAVWTFLAGTAGLGVVEFFASNGTIQYVVNGIGIVVPTIASGVFLALLMRWEEKPQGISQ